MQGDYARLLGLDPNLSKPREYVVGTKENQESLSVWTPKQLLTDEVVQTLLEAGYSSDQIEFLGWQSGTAGALNNSHNPALAANTILSRPKGLKMVTAFFLRKESSVVLRKKKDTDSTDTIFGKLTKLKEKAERRAVESQPQAKAAPEEDA